MGETAARFSPWPGGGGPGNLSEGAPGDPLVPFPSWGKERPAASGPAASGPAGEADRDKAKRHAPHESAFPVGCEAGARERMACLFHNLYVDKCQHMCYAHVDRCY